MAIGFWIDCFQSTKKELPVLGYREVGHMWD
jgi:hypothetical protein